MAASGGLERRSRPSLEVVLRDCRRRDFVGREHELDRFRRGLACGPGVSAVLLVHGLPGVGKTALLDRFADEARDAGRNLIRTDAADFDRTVADLFDLADRTYREQSDAPVLLVDALSDRPALEARLRDDILPALPGQTVVVLAGVRPPAHQWFTDLGWRSLVEVLHLPPLDRAEGRRLLQLRGLPERHVPTVLRFAEGNPLALCLAANEPSCERDWRPGRQLLRTLLSRVLDPAPSEAHQTALRVTAHVQHTTVDLLQSVLPTEAALQTFCWLSDLPFMTLTPSGLQPDGLVRRLVDSDHHWADPCGYDSLHRALWRHLGEQAQRGRGAAARTALAGLVYLHRYRHREWHERRAIPGGGLQRLHFTGDLTGDLASAVLALADAELGVQDRAVVRYWLDHDPGAFSVFGRAGQGRPSSFLVWLTLSERDSRHTAADPVLAAVWNELDKVSPLRDGEQVGLARFLVPRPRSGRMAVLDPRFLRIYEMLSGGDRRLASSYVVLSEPASCEPFMDEFDHRLQIEVDAVDGRRWGVFGHDWRVVAMQRHLERVLPEVDACAAPEPKQSWDHWVRNSFDRAVREVLRAWHDESALAEASLVRAGFADGRVSGDRVASVRCAVEESMSALGVDARRAKALRAVSVTYLRHSNLTQESAAVRLGIPLSTYRRHLYAGVTLLCDRLWSQSRVNR